MISWGRKGSKSDQIESWIHLDPFIKKVIIQLLLEKQIVTNKKRFWLVTILFSLIGIWKNGQSNFFPPKNAFLLTMNYVGSI